MAIAFYCEDDDPKMMFSGGGSGGSSYGYHYHHPLNAGHHQPQQEHVASSGVGAVDVNNNDSSSNCALHGETGESGGNSGTAIEANSSNRQLMRVLHQLLYQYTMEGVLSPSQTSCVFCNRIYYLFQLLY